MLRNARDQTLEISGTVYIEIRKLRVEFELNVGKTLIQGFHKSFRTRKNLHAPPFRFFFPFLATVQYTHSSSPFDFYGCLIFYNSGRVLHPKF